MSDVKILGESTRGEPNLEVHEVLSICEWQFKLTTTRQSVSTSAEISPADAMFWWNAHLSNWDPDEITFLMHFGLNPICDDSSGESLDPMEWRFVGGMHAFNDWNVLTRSYEKTIFAAMFQFDGQFKLAGRMWNADQNVQATWLRSKSAEETSAFLSLHERLYGQAHTERCVSRSGHSETISPVMLYPKNIHDDPAYIARTALMNQQRKRKTGLLDMSPTNLTLLIKSGKFPKPLNLPGKRQYFELKLVQEWMLSEQRRKRKKPRN